MSEDLDDDPAVIAFLREVARTDDPVDDRVDDTLGGRLGKFRIGARLGAGSMGVVYEAVDETLGRDVAIKVVRRETAEGRARFLEEARAAAAVVHPNLVAIHEVGEVGGRVYLAMELVRGNTLRGQHVALPVVRQIADGLAAVHAAGIVHRDLKPDNVMLGDDGRVRLLDFGIAKAEGSPMTGAGTPKYMSPEQARGGPVDARSDVYAFGVMAKELLGRSSRVLDRCTASAPEARYRDAREVAAALRHGSRRWAWFAVPVLLVAAVAVAVAWPRSHEITRWPIAARPGVTAASPDALAAYRGALQALRDGQFFDSVSGLERAVMLDPGLAAAQLRLGLLKRFFHDPREGRAAFAIAVQLRGQLDDHDRALLDAAEPSVMREPYDYAESKRRFERALRRYPEDSELLYWLATSLSELGEHAAILPLVERMQRIDPGAAIAQGGLAITLAYLGRLDEARAQALRCREIAPTRAGCAMELIKILETMGRCDELAEELRAWSTASPDEPRAPVMLGQLLVTTGAPERAAADQFAEAARRAPADDRVWRQRTADLDMAWARGDFATLEQGLRAQDEGAAAYEGAHANAVRDLLTVLDEQARDDDARTLAAGYLARRAGWQSIVGTSDANLFNDARGVAIAHAGTRADRDAWVRELDAHVGPGFRPLVWAVAYAEPARTPDDARDALANLRPQPVFYWFSRTYGAVGRAFALAGRPDDARPYLERATHLCLRRDPRDFAALGDISHGAAACQAYRGALRWPTGRTADHARAQLAALHCPP